MEILMRNLELLVQICGWLGMFLIVSAYAIVSYGKVAGGGKVYQFLNLAGAICMGVNVFYNRAWPALALQVVWGVIAIAVLLRKEKRT